MGLRIKKRLKKVNLKFLFLFIMVAVLIYFAQPQIPFLIGGLTIVLLGEIVRSWATGHLQKNEVLTTSGPYGYVKNPMYVGSFIVMLGFNAMAVSPYIAYILGIELLAFIIYYVPTKTKTESARLLEKFGQAYADYDRAVPGYIIKRLTPYKPNPDEPIKPWSKTIFLENNEHHVGLAILVGVAALICKFWFYK
jgi:protein-S-isoprenylcysteine O-methyltransferase Ste14